MGTAGEVMRVTVKAHAALRTAKATAQPCPFLFLLPAAVRSLQMGTAGEVMRTHGDTAWESEMCAVARRLNLERLKLIDSSQ